VAATEAPSKPRSVSDRIGRGERETPSCDREASDKKKGRDRDRSRKGDDGESSRKTESREPKRSQETTPSKEVCDDEEADRRDLAEIQGRIEARQAAKNLEIARDHLGTKGVRE